MRKSEVSTPTIRSRILKVRASIRADDPRDAVSTPTIRSRILKEIVEPRRSRDRARFNPNDPFEDTERVTLQPRHLGTVTVSTPTIRSRILKV